MPENLFWTVLVGSFAWLVGKRWEIAERRRLRYVEVACRLSFLFDARAHDRRRELLNEISKLWIDGDRNVVLAAEMALDALECAPGNADLQLRNLVVAMRRDARFLWNRDDLKPDDIKLR